MTHLIPEQTINLRAIMCAETISRLVSTSVLVGAVLFTAEAFAQPRFTEIRPLTNKEVRLQLSAPPGSGYRVDAATNPAAWSSLMTLTSSASSLVLTDSAAPYLPARFYRAEQLSLSNLFAGDHISTTNGDVVIQPINHASFVMRWRGIWIYNDPVGAATRYTGLPRADIILVSHHHGDHLSTTTIDAVRGSNAVIVCPLMVFNGLTSAQRAISIVLTNGATSSIHGAEIEAVPAYNISNSNHPRGVGNGYVVTLGGRRIYIAGDTEDVPEMRTLPDIDVAFIPMNRPFTMYDTNAAAVVRAFRPKVVYPYHYSPSTPTANLNLFKNQVGTDLGIEVRLRKWY